MNPGSAGRPHTSSADVPRRRVLIPPDLVVLCRGAVPLKTHIIYGILTSRLSQHPEVLFAGVGITLAGVLCCAGLARRRKTAARVLVIPALVLAVTWSSPLNGPGNSCVAPI